MPAQKLKTIIVDDEKLSRDALKNYINEFCPDIEIVAECVTANAAFKEITKYAPQLVFLDIEMPKGSGFDLLRKFERIEFKVIFVTAFSDYAVDAFRFSATDFLLKPVKVSELVEAVKKARRDLETINSLQNIYAFLDNIGAATDSVKKLVIANSHGFTVVKTSEIIMCEAEGYLTHFHLENKLKISSSHPLKYYEEILPLNQFLRVHNSFIININHVTNYSNQGEIQMTGKLKCSLSNSRKKEFLKIFKNKKV